MLFAWRARAERVAARTFEFTAFLVNILKIEDTGASFKGKLTWHDACHALRDEETSRLELAAARSAFERLCARADLARVDRVNPPPPSRAGTKLSPRERQVLGLIAEGGTNKAIAARLSVSERTVDRHVSNILMKLDVPSRAAAVAIAYEHELL